MASQDEFRPVTMRDIARRLGLSGAAVSMALRGQRGVSESTAERVRAVALEMGWRPNPLVSAYQSQVRMGRPPVASNAIAWADDMASRRPHGMEPVRIKMRMAAREHAAALGYTLEEISPSGLRVNAFERNVAIFKRIIQARGITGLVLPIGWRAHHALMDWSPLSLAVIGGFRGIAFSTHQLPQPRVPHSVGSDAFANARLAFDRLRAAGRRRIGLALSDFHRMQSDEHSVASHLLSQQGVPPGERVPVLALPAEFPADPPSCFAAWLRRHKVDAVLCLNNEMLHWVRILGRRVPDDVAVVHLNLGPMEAGWSGIDERVDAQSTAAVDLVIGQFGRNERSSPAVPKRVLLPGCWVAGATA